MATLTDEDIKELEALGFSVEEEQPIDPIETAYRSSLRAVPGTAGALVGMRTPGPLPAKIIGSIAGAFGADKLVKEGVKKFMPEFAADFSERLKEGAEKYPTVATLAEFIPDLFTSQVTLQGPTAAAKLAKSLVKRTGLNMTEKAAAKAAIKEAALSGTTAGSMDAVMQMATTGDIDPTRSLAATIAGGTLLQQNAIARKLSGSAPNPMMPQPKASNEAQPSELLVKGLLPAPEKILRDIPEAELLDNRPYVADIPPKQEKEVKLLLQQNPLRKPISDIVRIATPDGIILMSTVVKPEGVTVADPKRVLTKGRQMQAAKVRNESGSALTKEGKKKMFTSGFTAEELASMSDDYAAKLPITSTDYMSSVSAAMRRTAKPLQTSVEKVLADSDVMPVRAKDITKAETKTKKIKSPDEPSTSYAVKKSDASDIYGPDNNFVRITDNDSKGYIKLRVYPNGSASVVDLFVDENKRGKGVGQKLQAEALRRYPNLMGQVSSKAAATTAYRLGRRPVSNPNATIDDVYKMIDDETSVNLASKSQIESIKKPIEPVDIAKASILSGDTEPHVVRAKVEASGAENVDAIVSDTLRANHEIAMDRAYKKAQSVEDEPRMFYSLGVTPSQFIGDVNKAIGAVYDGVMNTAVRSVVDKLERSASGIDRALAPMFRNTITGATRLFAEFHNQTASEFNKYTNNSLSRVLRHMNEIQDTGSSSLVLTPDEVKLHKTVQDSFLATRQKQNDVGLPVKEGTGKNMTYRAGNLDPDYVPQMMSESTIKAFTTNKGEAITELRRQFIDWHVGTKGLTAKKANDLFDEIRNSFLSLRRSKSGNASTFGPLDKAAGIGIPPEWRDNDLRSVFRRYTNRASRRIAFFDNIEKHAWARQHLGIDNPYGPNVKLDEYVPTTGERVADSKSNIENINDLIDLIENRELRTKGADTWESVSRLVKSGIMGPVTGMRDFATGYYIGMQHLVPQQIPRFLVDYTAGGVKFGAGKIGGSAGKALKKVGAKNWGDYVTKSTASLLDDWERSLAKGVNSHHVANIENIDSLGRGLNYLMNKSADTLNMVQARTFFDQAARTSAFTAGRWAVYDMVRMLNSKGTHGKFLLPGTRKQLERQVEIFAGSKAKANNWITTGKISEMDLNEAAAKFVESTQGTYNANGLPLYTINHSSLSGMTSLARWSIEKLGNFDKYVVQEARNGNWMPAIMNISTGLIGGAAMNTIFKEVTGKEPIIPEVSEVMTAAETDNLQADELLYTLAAYAQVAGVAGIGSDMLYRALLTSQSSSIGEGALSFVAFDEAQAIQQGLSDLVSWAMDSELPQEDKNKMIMNGLNNVILRRIQGYRLIKDRFGDKISKEWGIENRKANAKKVARKFDYLYGYDKINQTFTEPSIKGASERAFRSANTLERINETFRPAVQSVINRTTNERQSPQALLNALEGLSRGESSSIIPGFNAGDKYKATQFLNFVRGAEGDKGLDETVKLFEHEENVTDLKKKMINALKGSQ